MPRRVLVYCYFCPEAIHRPGGVQQLIGPLLASLGRFGWDVSVAHPGGCLVPTGHHPVPATDVATEADWVPVDALCEVGERLERLVSGNDVMLSVDRALPWPLRCPAVLMSNTLNYVREAAAVQAGHWNDIIVPTASYGDLVRSFNRDARIRVIPYGLREVANDARTSSDSWRRVVRLPHRPDARKGHEQAIRGLAGALPASRDISLIISWLGESRYSKFRVELEELAADLGVAQQVIFSPWLDVHSEHPSADEYAALLQIGSFLESFGLSVVESVLRGIPAITLPQPAIREVVGDTGLLIEIADPLDWFAEFSRYTNENPSLRESPPDSLRGLTIARMAAGYHEALAALV